jgi:hypothetical protein
MSLLQLTRSAETESRREGTLLLRAHGHLIDQSEGPSFDLLLPSIQFKISLNCDWLNMFSEWISDFLMNVFDHRRRRSR